MTSGNCRVLLALGLSEVDIDLAVNLGDVGLLIDAKGGVHEFPKHPEKIRWHAIIPDDVFQRFQDNKENAHKWDEIARVVRNEVDILEYLNLANCEEIIPMIVHVKTQPISIESYRKKHSCPDYETETHSLDSMLLRLRELNKL